MTETQPSLYLEDLTLGQIFESGSVTVTSDAIKRFAAEFDPQPFHLDEEAAKTTLFGGLAASGWLTTAMTMRLMVDSFPLAGGLIGAGVDALRWVRPVRPGDRLKVRCEVLELRPSKSRPDRGMAKVRVVTLDQDGEAVQSFVSDMVLQRR